MIFFFKGFFSAGILKLEVLLCSYMFVSSQQMQSFWNWLEFILIGSIDLVNEIQIEIAISSFIEKIWNIKDRWSGLLLTNHCVR